MLIPGSGSPRSEPGHCRVLYFILAAGAVLVVQWLCLELRIPAIKPESFAARAVELKVTRPWRYGYVQLWHGAVLVKARNRAIPAGPGWEPQVVGSGGEVYGLMQRELQALPRKAGLEAGLYLGLLGYVFFGWGRLQQVVLARRRSRGRVLMAAGLGWTLLWIIAGLPLLLWGYGTPLFTNCVGPGALSCSGVFLGRAPAYGLTVSYHLLLTVVVPWFLALAWPIFWIASHFPRISEGLVVWLAGWQFFLAWGFFRGLCHCWSPKA
jgi:hypothetical protein